MSHREIIPRHLAKIRQWQADCRARLHKRRVILLWKLGRRGAVCQCSFYEASHYDHSLEFDLSNYPCGSYRPEKPRS